MLQKLLSIIKKFGIYIIALLSIIVNGYFLISKDSEMVVTEVHDGDTFTLKNGDRIRLLGIDAPELGNCGAEESAKFLESMILGKSVKITDEKKDGYGRIMALVWVGITKSTLVNEEMLKEGLARANYDPNSRSEDLKEAYNTAKEKEIGIFSSLCKIKDPTPPSKNCVIKGNIDQSTNTHYYHLPNCRHYNQIVIDLDRGENFFCSESEAQKAGFSLAPDCLR